MRSRRRARRDIEAADLDITAFMNLMVILVPFLLITAVFSRLAILELNVPASSSEPAEDQEETLQLEITVRESLIEVGDRRGFVLARIENTTDGYDFERLSDKLKEIKDKNPDKTDATLLLEQDIPYDIVVQVMDKMRVREDVVEDAVERTDLFPDISMGDAVAAPAGEA